MNEHPLIAAVLDAKAAALTATTPAQYREAQRALSDATDALQKRRDFLYCEATEEGWLPRNWWRLENLVLALPPEEFKAKEMIWMERLTKYEDICRVLADALVAVALSESATPEAPAMEQLEGLL